MAHPSTDALNRAFSEHALSVFSVSRHVDAPGTSVVRPSIRSCLHFIVTGSMRIDNASEALEVEANAIAHTHSDDDLRFTTEDGCTYITVSYVWGHADNDADARNVFDSAWSFLSPESASLVKRASDLERLGESPDLESRLNQIIGATAFIKGLFSEQSDQDAPEGLRRARAYIDAHFAEPLTLDLLGSVAGLSPKRFSERFSQTFGTRPLAYLITRRMEHARELLGTDMLVKDIAKAVGYDDQFYFSRIFKKYCGVSPETLRRQLREHADGGGKNPAAPFAEIPPAAPAPSESA